MKSFEELNVSEEIHRAVKELGYVTPSPIQQQALPLLLGEPTDFIGLAATGTGKTAAFGIPLLMQIDRSKKVVQGLIMCPTRELALQVTGQINLLGKYKGIKALAVYGGSDYLNQIHGLKHGAQIVVGTPGRLIDHLDRGNLKLNDLKALIMDEADEMISMGFREDLEKLLAATSESSKNIWLFSATMSRDIRKIADKYLVNPKQVQVNRTEMLSNTVEQIYYRMKESDKPEILCRIIGATDDFYGLVFCQTKAMVSDLTAYLLERGIKVDCLHGDKDQNSREKTMLAFRNKRVNLLICTDVASRGLDVKDITHVINYSLPRETELYIHRIGRTARGGKAGIALSLVTPSHEHLVKRLEQVTKSKIKEGKLPNRRDLAVSKLAKMLPQFQNEQFHPRVMELLSEEWKTAVAGLLPEEIAARFIATMMPEFFDDRPKSKPLQVAQEAVQRPPRQDSGRSRKRFGGGGSRGGRDRDRGDRRDDRSGDRRDARGSDDRRGGGDRSDAPWSGGRDARANGDRRDSRGSSAGGGDRKRDHKARDHKSRDHKSRDHKANSPRASH